MAKDKCPPHKTRTTTEEIRIGNEIVTYEKIVCADCGTLIANTPIHRRPA